MTLNIHDFGEILMSRPAGKEAFSLAKAYIIGNPAKDETISLDFKDVKVLAPSWADEFITSLKNEFHNPIVCLNTENESVSQSLKYVNFQFSAKKSFVCLKKSSLNSAVIRIVCVRKAQVTVSFFSYHTASGSSL